MIDKELLKSSEYKKIRYITDVDVSVDRFENNFLNTYANLLPKETAVDKAFLIKNVLPLYLSKGSERAFKYLFRLLFDENVEVRYLRDNILRASDGKWVKENCVNVDATTIKSIYTGDNEIKQFNILDNYFEDDIEVYVDGVLTTTGFEVHTSYKKIIFDTAPSNNTSIEVVYNTINKSIFYNRKLTGLTSGATALIEKTSFQLINGRQTLKLYVDKKTIKGKFLIGEKVKTDLFINNILVDVIFETISELNYIKIIDGGANYNVGDPVAIISAGAKEEAAGIIEEVFIPVIEELTIIDGGAGFQIGQNILADGISEPLVNAKIVDVTNERTINVFTVYSDVISDIDFANTTISASDFGLSVSNVNLSSNINSSFSDISYTNIGEIYIIEINSIEVPFESAPTIDVLPSTVTIPNIGYTSSQTTVSIDTYGSLGKIIVLNGGSNYKVGDEIVFNKKPGCLGVGAEAEVRRINSAGSIVEVAFVPAKISGTVNVSLLTSNVHVTGTGTKFTTELKEGDKIMIDQQQKVVDEIFSDTSLTVTNGFRRSFTNKKIRFYGRYLVGGQGYSQDKLPTIAVNSALGSNANLQVSCIMGAGDNIVAEVTPLNGKKVKQIEKIKVLSSGEGFVSIPEIDLSSYGSGNAKAEGVLYPTFQVYEGKWITTDSIISSSDRRLQGLNYYIDFSYLLTSNVQLIKYDSIVKSLLHPAGYIGYSQVTKTNVFSVGNVTVESSIQIIPGVQEDTNLPVNIGNTFVLLSNEINNFESNVSGYTLNVTEFDMNFGNNLIISTNTVKDFEISVKENELNVTDIPVQIANTFALISANTYEFGLNIANSHVIYSKNTNDFAVNANVVITSWELTASNIANISIKTDISSYIAQSQNTASVLIKILI